jgi:hypothetical protein
MPTFEDIKPGSRVRGLDPAGIAEVVQIARFGPDALNLVFRVDGRVGEHLRAGDPVGWSGVRQLASNSRLFPDRRFCCLPNGKALARNRLQRCSWNRLLSN